MAKFLVSIDNAEDPGERLPPAVRDEIAALPLSTTQANADAATLTTATGRAIAFSIALG